MNIQAALVRSVLDRWHAYAWTVQGFGMVRTKIYDVGRIHIWDSLLRAPRVSDVHAHPWPLRSTVISGELVNQRFKVVHEKELTLAYSRCAIATGEGGGLRGEPEDVALFSLAPEVYHHGEVYEQAPEELHRTIAQDGTVTLLERPLGEPLQETVVLWPRGTEWVSAEPREAIGYEIERAVKHALARWWA